MFQSDRAGTLLHLPGHSAGGFLPLCGRRTRRRSVHGAHQRIQRSVPRPGWALSPIDGIGPDQLHMRELLSRVQEGEFKEVIVATNPNTAGDATALYIAQELRPFIESSSLRVTRLAAGLPMGGDLEYADEVTLGRALSGRSEL